MIRLTRVCFLGKSKFNIPVFPQRAVSHPNQIFVDFSVTADKVHVRTEEKKGDNLISDSMQSRKRQKITLNDLKYHLFKQYLTGFGNEKQLEADDEKSTRDFYEKLSTLTLPEIIKVLGLIVQLRSRPPDCLKILCTLLTSFETTFNASDCANILFYFAKLSYKDENLLNSICNHLKTLCPDLNCHLAVNILYSLSTLKVRNSELLQLLLQQIVESPVVLKNSLKVLKALTILNYKSVDVDRVIQPLSRLEELDFIHSLDYLSFIWSCIILDKYDCIYPDQLRKVLSSNYLLRVIKTNAIAPLKWKLLNVNVAAQLWSSYNGPILDGHSSFKTLVSSVPKKNSPLLDAVTDTLGHIIPPGCVKPNVNIGTGFILDVEYSKYSSNKFNTEQSEGKYGIVLLNYGDICSDGTVTGMTEFKLKILRELQFKVFTLGHNEFPISQTLSTKVELLRSKISKMEEQYKDQGQTSTQNS